jgi:hypothetical protein
MKTLILTEGNKEVHVIIDGESVTVELVKGFPAGAKAEDIADVMLKDIATKDKVSHKPHTHTTEGAVIYTGA